MRQTDRLASLPWGRGVLRPDEARQAFQLRLYPPHPELSPWVEYYWNVEWDLGDRAFTQTILSNPSVDLSFEDDPGTNGPGTFAVVTGVVPRTYQRHLVGRGQAFAVHFHPGQFRPWWDEGVQTLTGQAFFVGDGPRAWEALARSLASELLAGGHERRVALADELLLAHRPPADPRADEIQQLVRRCRDNPDLWNARVLADLRGVSPRTNQRQFLEYVGVGPKWVVMRHRIQSAVTALDAARDRGEVVDLTRLSLDLGYFDLSHFSREFRNLIGVSPDQYQRSFRSPGP